MNFNRKHKEKRARSFYLFFFSTIFHSTDNVSSACIVANKIFEIIVNTKMKITCRALEDLSETDFRVKIY